MNYPAPNQGQPQGGQYEKNPNGGYLNQNQYGLFGHVDITPELLAEIQRTGKVNISVSKPEQRGAGGDTWVSARTVLKPYAPKEGYGTNQPQGGQPQYAYAPEQIQQAPVAQPQQVASAPAQGAPLVQDEIPW